MGCQKHPFFEAPGVSLGGSGVSIGGVKILREWTIQVEGNEFAQFLFPLKQTFQASEQRKGGHLEDHPRTCKW